MDLIIVRHGRPLRHVVEDGSGPADPGLSDVGIEQAERTAAFLETDGIDHIVSSTMRRARETAQPLAERLGLEIEQLDEIRESDHRSNTYIPYEEMSPDDPDSARYFEDDLMTTIFSDGYEPFEKRVGEGFEHIIATNKSKRVAVFCHGMVTMVLLRTILGIEDVFSLSVDYCGISRVRASTSGARSVRSFNETHHVRELLES